MKELWSILMEKVKQVEPNAAALGIGITGLFALAMTTRIIVALFKMIVEIVNAFAGQPVG
jgi:hypothetical protein